MSKDISLQIKNLGVDNDQDIVYVGKYTGNNEEMTVEALYNVLYPLRIPFMLKAKRFSRIDKIKLGKLELVCKEIVNSFESSHRVIFGDKNDMDGYNPFGWDEGACEFFCKCFHRYFQILGKFQISQKKTLGVYVDQTVKVEEQGKYLKAVRDCIVQETLDEIYLYDSNQLIKDELSKLGKIRILDFSQEVKENCIVDFCSCSYFVGTASPFSNIVNALKGDIGKFSKIYLIDHNKLQNNRLYELEKTYKEYISNESYHKFCFLRVKNKSACFSEYMRQMADKFVCGKTVAKCLIEEGISVIGIYGWGTVGKILYSSLKESSGIQVEYIVDKNEADYEKVILPVQIKSQRAVDILLVSPIFYYEEILDELREIGVLVPIIPLELYIYK